ncbi:heterokaryon incompatibility protein-domain-containing protein, partial [Ilyonectria robusta]|uniref:heterokaryon incompatibility protein-domain-containing protein n=1 Tax=Ilyonectria robusta TaxID=1079257 RepID=UPI001E8EA002
MPRMDSAEVVDGPDVPSMSVSTDCMICANLRRMFIEDEFWVDLGMIDKLLETRCSGHDPLLKHFREQFDDANNSQLGQEEEDEEGGEEGEGEPGGSGARKSDDEKSSERVENIEDAKNKEGEEGSPHEKPKDDKPGPGPYNIYLSRYDEPHGQIHIEESSNSGRLWDVLLARGRDEPQTPGYGRVLDPDWVNLELARQWKKDCFTKHGDKCSNPFKINHVSPAWLIDTANDCLVPGTDISDFVTLSYRWGDSAAFRLNRDLLPTLLMPGSLSPDQLGAELPPGIRHAMQLVHEIEERYLWVDSVCIVQDDKTHSMEQLRLMGAIYSSATLTIVASDGDATEGILGLQGSSPSREFKQAVIPVFENEKVIVRQLPLLESLSGCSLYFERGWTFQEFYLSKRRLIFANNQMQWSCSCAAFHEDLIAAEDASGGREHADRLLSTLLNGQPDFSALSRLLSDYNHRQLTYPEDALPGISGLFALLSRSFEGGFLFGLPETCFDSALMWRTSLTTEMTRREDSGRTNLLDCASPLPSWSWISWECFAMAIVTEETFTVGSRGSRTMPITQWYTHATPDATVKVKRPIQANWFRLAEKFKASGYEVPEGWTREEYEETKHNPGEHKGRDPPHGLGKYIYRPVDVPDQYFWLPVPKRTVGETAEPFNPPQTPYISCRTWRGWFAAARIPNSKFSDNEIAYERHKLEAGLLDHQGNYCGRLNLHTTDDISLFPEADSDVDFKVELVAICRREEIGGENRYCVLWVEWVAGVAYRKASGTVNEHTWDKHGVEEVDLIL